MSGIGITNSYEYYYEANFRYFHRNSSIHLMFRSINAGFLSISNTLSVIIGFNGTSGDGWIITSFLLRMFLWICNFFLFWFFFPRDFSTQLHPKRTIDVKSRWLYLYADKWQINKTCHVCSFGMWANVALHHTIRFVECYALNVQ